MTHFVINGFAKASDFFAAEIPCEEIEKKSIFHFSYSSFLDMKSSTLVENPNVRKDLVLNV